MRTLRLLLVVPLTAAAQFPPPVPTGVLLERDRQVVAGQFSVRAPDNQVYRYRFDGQTAVESGNLPASVERLNPGEKVEVGSDPVAGSLVRYARTVRVVAPVAPLRVPADTRLRGARPAEPAPLTGTLTFAGVVSRLDGRRLVLRTRDGEQTILIRQDTRYVSNGDAVVAGELRPNMRVFVSAGRNLYEQVEAYRIVWGTIFQPGHP
jgi:hypothetical protein